MTTAEVQTAKVIELIEELLDEDNQTEVKADSPLVGDDAFLRSRELVELLLAIEEYAEDDLDVEFDWQSDSAMSQRRSMFRTPATLGAHLAELVNEK